MYITTMEHSVLEQTDIPSLTGETERDALHASRNPRTSRLGTADSDRQFHARMYSD